MAAEAIPPRDPRIKQLYDLLRGRRLLGQSPWLKARLVRIWQNGLAARPRPRLTRRLVQLLRRWGLLAGTTIALPPVNLVSRYPAYRRRRAFRRRRPRRGLRPLRVMAVRRLRPVGVRSMGVRSMSTRRFTGRRFRGLSGSQP